MSLVQLEADEAFLNERLDKYLGAVLPGPRDSRFLHRLRPGQSRSYVQKLIKEGGVRVNGKAEKASYRLGAEDRIQVDIPRPEEPEILAEEIPLDILYEDEDLLMVNKPKGMVVHPAAGHWTGTLVNAVMYHCRGQLSGINGMMRPGIVHRIDRDTTGVLVICKNDHAHNHVAEQLKEHSITRKYAAIVTGVLKADTGTIDTVIGRHPTERKKMAAGVKNGKRAVTHYRVLQRFERHTLIECQLETGRTHQIRVHMASIGHPILGDTVYGSSRNPFHLEGQALHAQVLGLIHPVSGDYVEAEAPLPEYFQLLLKKL